MCTKLYNLAKASDPQYLRNKEFVKHRDSIHCKVESIRRTLTEAAKNCRNQEIPQSDKVSKLRS